MKLRPCIDIHNGKVKQIVGGSLNDGERSAVENFVSEHEADYYASMYKEDDLPGGHIIMLNPVGTEEYKADMKQAEKALSAYPGGMQIGGGITADSAAEFIEMGASHVIVTSYVFRDGIIDYHRLERLVEEAGKEHLVLDLSCRRRGDSYYIVTDRWQKYTDTIVNQQTLEELSEYCSEYLIHAVDSEGKKAGIDEDLVSLLSVFDGCPMTYAGGVRSIQDLQRLHQLGKGRLDVTVGSALDLFGGDLPYHDIVKYIREINWKTDPENRMNCRI